MSSVVISGNTSGTITLDAPAVAGTTTLTLPVQTGTVMVNGPAFSAYLSSGQSITSATFIKVQCNTEEFDTNSNYDNTTNYRFTPTVAGYYQISGGINFGSTTKVEFLTSIFKNGSEFKRGTYVAISTVLSQSCAVSALVYLNGTTDYVELYGYLDGSGSMLYNGTQYNVYFQGAMVRSA